MPWVSVAMLIFLATPALPVKPVKRQPDARPTVVANTKRPTSAPATKRAAAKPAAARPVAKPVVANTNAPAAKRKPDARTPIARAPARRAPARRAAPKDRAKARPAVARRAAARTKAAKPAPAFAMPFFKDTSVQQIRLKNGLVCWCKSLPHAQLTQVKLAIAAGSATDPKGLAGTASFLGALFKQALNQPKNPPHSSLPIGGSYYDVKVHKDWTILQVQLKSGRMEESLTHIAKGLKGPLSGAVPTALRKSLKRGAGKFPPPALLERVEAYLFRGQPHGRLARGKQRTFENIQKFRLQTSWNTLYRAHRMRLLVVGKTDCEKVKGVLTHTLGGLPNQTSKKDKIKLYITSKTRPSGRLLLPKEMMHLYQLPALKRADFVPLWLLEQIAVRELRHQLGATYGSFPVQPAIQPFAHNGYMLFSMPLHSPLKRALDKAAKKSLGTLRMQPYPPALKQRIQMRYRTQIDLHVRGILETTKGTASLLFPQLLLPEGAVKGPQAALPLVAAIKPGLVRHIARKYMGHQVSFRPGAREFTFPRVILFVVTLLLIWVLLDQTFRRNRSKEE